MPFPGERSSGFSSFVSATSVLPCDSSQKSAFLGAVGGIAGLVIGGHCNCNDLEEDS